MMKKTCFLLLASAVMVGGCKKNDNTDNGPSCTFEQSRPLKDIVTSEGNTTTIQYSYDADGRSLSYRYPAADTASETVSTGLYAFYFFDSNGDQVRTSQYRDSAGQQDPVADFFYEYDSNHRLVKKYSYSNNPKRLLDSVACIWQDGNLIEDRDLTGTGNSVFYEYYPGTKGASIYNMPVQASRWLYNPVAHVVLSNNFIHKAITKNSAGAQVSSTNYDAGFDEKGRVKSIDNGQTRQSITYECY